MTWRLVIDYRFKRNHRFLMSFQRLTGAFKQLCTSAAISDRQFLFLFIPFTSLHDYLNMTIYRHILCPLPQQWPLWRLVNSHFSGSVSREDKRRSAMAVAIRCVFKDSIRLLPLEHSVVRQTSLSHARPQAVLQKLFVDTFDFLFTRLPLFTIFLWSLVLEPTLFISRLSSCVSSMQTMRLRSYTSKLEERNYWTIQKVSGLFECQRSKAHLVKRLPRLLCKYSE